jgi:YbbR domain-containing protein
MGAFPKKEKWKEMLIFLFFFLLSFGFWLLQTLQQDYEKKIELPLKMINVPKDWVISKESEQDVRIVLKDKGTTLMHYFWKSSISPIDISFINVTASSDSTVVITNRMLRNAIDKQLVSSTSIVSIDPADVTVKYDKLSAKTVPVIPNLKIVTKQGFQISDSIKIDNPTVKLYASKKILDRLDDVKTKLVTLNNVSKTKEVTAKLDLPEGVSVDDGTVKLTIPIEEFTEKTFRLPILCTDIPDGFMLRIFPSTVDVVCSIPISHFKDLTENLLEIHVLFRDFKNNQVSGKLPLRLTAKPDWLTNENVKIVPENVEFIIEQVNK